MLPLSDPVSHCPSTGAELLVPVGRGVEVAVDVEVDVDAVGVEVGEPDAEHPATARTRAPAASSRCRHPAERGGTVQGAREVALEQAAQDAVGELGDLGRARRRGRPRDDRVDGGEHLGAALVQQCRALGVLADQQPQQVDAPQRAGQALGIGPRPELRQRVDPVRVGVRDEPVDDVGVGVLAHAGEQRSGGLVRDATDLGGILPAQERLEHPAREGDRLVVSFRHCPILPRARDGCDPR